MKSKLLITGIVVCAVAAAVTGCKKEEAPAPPEAPKAKTSEGLASEASKAVDTAKATAKEATDQAAAQAKAAEQQTQALIDRAKALVADQKYQDALGSLNQLASTKLTAEQQKVVDDLKAKIQSALAKATATDAGSVLGGALGGKK